MTRVSLSDWGCVFRVSQMLFFFSLTHSISQRFCLSVQESLELRRGLLEGFTECRHPQAVFGIQRLLELGESQNRGEKGKHWIFFSVVSLFQSIFESKGQQLPPLYLRNIKLEVPLDNFIVIIDTQGTLSKMDLLRQVFPSSESSISSIDCQCKSDFSLESKFNTKFDRKVRCFSCEWSKSLILIILSQIGTRGVSSDQYLLIRELLSLPSSAGALGGIDKNAYYFIGYLEPDSLVYLDPHLVQDSVNSIGEPELSSYQAKNPMIVKYTKISTSFASAFSISSYREFEDLLESLKAFERCYKNDYFLASVFDEKIDRDKDAGMESTLSIVTFS